MATTYDIIDEDKALTEVEEGEKAALDENEELYGGMIKESDKYYQDQIKATKDWAKTQTKLQNEKTDFAIEQIEQQKDQAKKDYTKEQSGAYVDWQKASNEYGANAEQMAAQGMTNTGFSESSQVSMYNTYQNRVASARESYMRAVLNYDNAIKDARLQNNSILAEIAYNALQKQLELSLQGFQYKNTLLTEKAKQKATISQNYYQRYMNVLDKIYQENSLNENARQFDENKALQQAQLQLQRDQFNWQKEQAALKASSGSGSIKKSSGGSKSSGSSKKSSSGSFDKSSGTKKEVSVTTGVTVDMQSVLDLGYGPISASRLNELVESGKVVEYENGGKLYYKKVFAGK